MTEQYGVSAGLFGLEYVAHVYPLALLQRERQACAIDWRYVLAYLRRSRWPIERRMAELWANAALHDTAP